jgi:hypothetical protein
VNARRAPQMKQRSALRQTGCLLLKRRHIASTKTSMKISRIVIVSIALLVPQPAAAGRNPAAERAWKPFFASFRAAVQRRDREALKKMMVKDFYFSGGGGDDNQDGDMRDDAFNFWDKPYIRGWEALGRTLRLGTAPTAAWWNCSSTTRCIGRVSPPAANSRRVINRASIDWLAFFEFREGHWYCTSFSECCD